MTLYDLLEVSPKASVEVIKNAYKALAKKTHPDRFAENEKVYAEERMKKLNNAYEILCDPVKRKSYDAKLLQSERIEHSKDHADSVRTYTQSRKDDAYKAPSQTATEQYSSSRKNPDTINPSDRTPHNEANTANRKRATSNDEMEPWSKGKFIRTGILYVIIGGLLLRFMFPPFEEFQDEVVAWIFLISFEIGPILLGIYWILRGLKMAYREYH